MKNIGCKYCTPDSNGRGEQFDTSGRYCALYTDKRSGQSSIQFGDWDFEIDFDVFYCPMCGRKLCDNKKESIK